MVTPLLQVKNHLAAARDNLLAQDKNRPNLDGLLSAIIEPLQDIENSLFELSKNRSLNSATGFYLDGIGAIIGEVRNYRNDDDYRLAILIRIISNNGGGTADEILIILSSIYPNSKIKYTECGNAFFQIQIERATKPIGINQLLSKLKPIGVSVPVVAHSSQAHCFCFAESNKEVCTLLFATGSTNESATTTTGDNVNITFGTFASAANALAFAEIIVERSDLNLNDGNKYLIAKKRKLEILRSYQDYTIQGGGAFSELITNE